MASTANLISEATCVVRATASKKGRTCSVEPGKTPMRQLHYGRIIADAGDAPIQFNTEGRETGLISLAGKATVRVAGQTFELTPYSALYVPRNTAVEVAPSDKGCDLAELSAPVTGDYPVQFVSFDDVVKNPKLHFMASQPPSERNLHILIGDNVKAGRILAGVTFSTPGNWTSWPPHEHTEMLEEAYLYVNMPKPSWGVQFVYTNTEAPEVVAVVHQDDCVLMPAGYHPNVSAPGGTIGFLWMMAAHREVVDRSFGVVHVQPEYAAGGSNLQPK